MSKEQKISAISKTDDLLSHPTSRHTPWTNCDFTPPPSTALHLPQQRSLTTPTHIRKHAHVAFLNVIEPVTA